MKTALLVEGDGDVLSFPMLFRNVVNYLGLNGCIYSGPPIKVGDPTGAIKSEKFMKLFTYAIGSSANSGVLICLDSDDYCPFSASEAIYERMKEIANSFKKPVAVCLFEREYESMFLADIENMAKSRSEIAIGSFDESNWKVYRDAKGIFSNMLKGVSYKETRDQVRYTSFINLHECQGKYRPLKHFCNALEWLALEDFSSGYLYNSSRNNLGAPSS